MGGRELVILLLGLAVVAVVLRGLVVAINARRGQIKLAIDKNIPSDVDIDALELAELPGGGARVVDRSLEQVNRQNSALDMAETKAKTLDLTDDDSAESHIPVLMDAVELAEVRAEADQHKPEEIGIEAVSSNDEDDDDPDSVLFDYNNDEEYHYEQDDQQALNPLSAVAPDYVDEADTEIDSIAAGQLSKSDDQHAALDQWGEHESEDEQYADESYQSESVEDGYEDEPEQEIFDPANSIDEFSMTAGQRIGDNTAPIRKTRPPNSFDEMYEDEQPLANKPKKSRSLFSLFGRKSAEQKRQIDSEPDLAPEIKSKPIAIEERQEERQIEQEIPPLEQERNEKPGESTVDELEELRSAPASAVIDKPQSQAEAFEHSEVLVINVAAQQGRVFAGDDLLHILITAGLKFGDMNIFHKRLSKDRQGGVIFSVANMLNPGTFDLNDMEEFTTLGISFFLALPTAINNLDAFEQMLGIAQNIRAALDGELKDDHRNGMTTQTIEHYRQRIRDFELRRLKAVAARG